MSDTRREQVLTNRLIQDTIGHQEDSRERLYVLTAPDHPPCIRACDRKNADLQKPKGGHHTIANIR